MRREVRKVGRMSKWGGGERIISNAHLHLEKRYNQGTYELVFSTVDVGNIHVVSGGTDILL